MSTCWPTVQCRVARLRELLAVHQPQPDGTESNYSDAANIGKVSGLEFLFEGDYTRMLEDFGVCLTVKN